MTQYGARDVVFRRENDGTLSFAIPVGVDEATSYSQKTLVVDIRVMGPERFRALFDVATGVWSVDVAGDELVNLFAEVFPLQLADDHPFCLLELISADVFRCRNIRSCSSCARCD